MLELHSVKLASQQATDAGSVVPLRSRMGSDSMTMLPGALGWCEELSGRSKYSFILQRSTVRSVVGLFLQPISSLFQPHIALVSIVSCTSRSCWYEKSLALSPRRMRADIRCVVDVSHVLGKRNVLIPFAEFTLGLT